MRTTDSSSHGETPWIRVRNLAFAYGQHRILQDIDLELHPGRHYIIAGPNGAGKSTLLDLLANLKKPIAGDLEVMGRRLAAYGTRDLAHCLALAPQEFQFNFPFSVREVVAMGRRPFLGRWGALSDRDHAIVADSLTALHLDSLAERPVTALSGGERRRCVVARALAQDTPILLLDEPSAGLDIAQALTLMALARKLADAGRLVITVSHDLNLSAAFGHEFIFLKNGALAAQGPLESEFSGETLSRIYETPARVRYDDFIGGYAVSFKLDREDEERAIAPKRRLDRGSAGE